MNVAKGSLAELETQLIIARELGYGDADQSMEIMSIAEEESRMISGLMRKIGETT